MKSTNKDVKTLMEMLAWMRPAGSRTERRFIREYIEPLGVTQDKMGNLYKRIGTAPVLWSCHTDTVHRRKGVQKLILDGMTARLPMKTESNCLGADDTVGVWLMCEMIRAERPGLYVFHRAEEIGGKGSRYIALNTPELLQGIDMAIALDRRGYTDVITHQFGRCCSDDFALSLANELGMGFKPSSDGIFTDTANYAALVGECTNISVGYFGQHTQEETLDLAFAIQLRDVLCSLDTRNLTVKRKPGEIDPEYHFVSRFWKGWDGNADQEPCGPRTMRDIVREYPTEVAELLRDLGYDAPTLWDELESYGATPF